MRGDLPRSEAKAVVRHLLTGCASCRVITGRLWSFGDMPLTFEEEGLEGMTDVEAVQEQLRDIVRGFEALRFRLLGVAGMLPAVEEETAQPEGVEAVDPRAEIRTVIECVLHDSIEPAIGDLRGVFPSSPQPSNPAPRPLE